MCFQASFGESEVEFEVDWFVEGFVQKVFSVDQREYEYDRDYGFEFGGN